MFPEYNPSHHFEESDWDDLIYEKLGDDLLWKFDVKVSMEFLNKYIVNDGPGAQA